MMKAVETSSRRSDHVEEAVAEPEDKSFESVQLKKSLAASDVGPWMNAALSPSWKSFCLE